MHLCGTGYGASVGPLYLAAIYIPFIFLSNCNESRAEQIREKQN
jgi:hypothetical protein